MKTVRVRRAVDSIHLVANDTKAVVVEQRGRTGEMKRHLTLRVYDITADDAGQEDNDELRLTQPMKVPN